MNWLKNRIQSFGYALQGVLTFLIEEPHAKVHLTGGVLCLIMGFYFEVNKTEWIVIILCIAAVFAAEMLNTALENLSNALTTDQHPLIKKTKDIAAAAVLVISLGAAIVGLMIFGPYFFA